MLDFVNQRTNHNVFYKPTLKTMLFMFFGFITVMLVGIAVYVKLKFLWTHWVVWFVGVLVIYITCVSGVVYDIIHDVPFVGTNRETGESVIFTSGVPVSLYRRPENNMELKVWSSLWQSALLESCSSRLP